MDEHTVKCYKAGLMQFLSAVQDASVALRKLIEAVDKITNQIENSNLNQIDKKGEI